MATITLGTNATTTLTAIKFVPGVNGMNNADVATINGLIRGQSAVQPRVNGYWTNTGLLHFPGGKGILKAAPGDYIGVDSQGWPILVSAWTIANGPWSHT